MQTELFNQFINQLANRLTRQLGSEYIKKTFQHLTDLLIKKLIS